MIISCFENLHNGKYKLKARHMIKLSSKLFNQKATPSTIIQVNHANVNNLFRAYSLCYHKCNHDIYTHTYVYNVINIKYY